MIKVSIFYPNIPGSRFDFDYYLNKHMPMSLKLLGTAIKSVSIERGIEGRERDSPPAHVALCHFVCDSREAFEAAFFPNASVLTGDMPNYTDIEPVIQMSEIAFGR
ncbi:MAG: EthD family reductase [Candidatus Binataceae bacterium]